MMIYISDHLLRSTSCSGVPWWTNQKTKWPNVMTRFSLCLTGEKILLTSFLLGYIMTVTFIITGIYTMYLSTVNNMYQNVIECMKCIHKKCANPINATALGMYRKHIE